VALKAAAKDGKPFCEECEKARKAAQAAGGGTPPPEQAVPVASPPPDAAPPADSVQAQTPHRSAPTQAQLAAQPNQNDGLDALRRVARETVARAFLGEHQGLLDTAARVDSILRSIDLDQPVELLRIPLETHAPVVAKLLEILPEVDLDGPVSVLVSQAAEVVGVAVGAPQVVLPPPLSGKPGLSLLTSALTARATP
jgi:hypothetical protein